jgi:hypothetical protein
VSFWPNARPKRASARSPQIAIDPTAPVAVLAVLFEENRWPPSTLLVPQLVHTRMGETEDGHHDTSVRYLDLDGDGVPDTMEITETRVLLTADLQTEAVQVIVELDTPVPAMTESRHTSRPRNPATSGGVTTRQPSRDRTDQAR